MDNFGYFEFFIISALLGVPAIVLVFYVTSLKVSNSGAN